MWYFPNQWSISIFNSMLEDFDTYKYMYSYDEIKIGESKHCKEMRSIFSCIQYLMNYLLWAYLFEAIIHGILQVQYELYRIQWSDLNNHNHNNELMLQFNLIYYSIWEFNAIYSGRLQWRKLIRYWFCAKCFQ